MMKLFLISEYYEKHIDVVIEEIVNNKDFEKSDTEIETFDNIEE